MTAEPDVVDLTRAMVAMDTINPPGNEARCIDHLGGLLDECGLPRRLRRVRSRPQQLGCAVPGPG